MSKLFSFLSGGLLFLAACSGPSQKVQSERLTDFVDPFTGIPTRELPFRSARFS